MFNKIKRFFWILFCMWCHGNDHYYYGERRYKEVLKEQGIEDKFFQDKIINRKLSTKY